MGAAECYPCRRYLFSVNDDQLLESIVDDAPSPEDLFASKERNAALWEAFLQLEPMQQTVLHMHFVEGWTLPRIARELDTSRFSVMRVQRAGLKKLRGLLEAPGVSGAT